MKDQLSTRLFCCMIKCVFREKHIIWEKFTNFNFISHILYLVYNFRLSKKKESVHWHNDLVSQKSYYLVCSYFFVCCLPVQGVDLFHICHLFLYFLSMFTAHLKYYHCATRVLGYVRNDFYVTLCKADFEKGIFVFSYYL